MTDIRDEDRRSDVNDRRTLSMDRRQFVDISWARDKERRLSGSERRQGTTDRRD